MRIHNAQLCVGRHAHGLQLHQQLERARQASTRLTVAAIGLQAANDDRIEVYPARQKGTRERARLNRIAERRARAMCLHYGKRVDCRRAVRQRREQQALLRDTVGRCETRAAAVLSHRTAQPVGRGLCRGRLFTAAGEGVDGLASCVPVRPTVKGVRAALDRGEAANRVSPHVPRAENHVDTGAQPSGALEALKAASAAMRCDERGGASRVVRDGRALHTQSERHATARH
eukprot:474632-Prymnesium_polylepis.2